MKRSLKRKLGIFAATILILSIFVISALQIGMQIRLRWKPWLPDYEKCDISGILAKEALNDGDYSLLYEQTGLTRLGIDGLIAKGDKEKIFEIQDQYFEEQEIEFYSFAPLTGYMRRTGKSEGCAYTAVLENGDILYSPSTFLSFFKLGHSAMVLSASERVLAQASNPDMTAIPLSFDIFFCRPAFVILRADSDKSTRYGVADYVANEILWESEYDILAGVFGAKAPESLEKTQCAHLIWYAYQRFGIDIDANGGKIVTPHDFLNSENLSVVQIYGIDPDLLQ